MNRVDGLTYRAVRVMFHNRLLLIHRMDYGAGVVRNFPQDRNTPVPAHTFDILAYLIIQIKLVDYDSGGNLEMVQQDRTRSMS